MTQLAKFEPPKDENPYEPHPITLDVEEVSACKELELSEPEVRELLKDKSLFKVDLNAIKAHQKLGRYLKKSGMVEYSRGKLLGREHCLEEARISMMELVTGEIPTPPELRVGAAHVVVKLVQAENESTKLGLELEKIAQEIASNQKSGKMPPPAGALVVVHSSGEVNIVEKEPAKG